MVGADAPSRFTANMPAAVRAARGDIARAVLENVRIQAQTLVEGSTVISSLVSSGKLVVAGGIFDLQSGRVEPVDLAVAGP